MNEAKMTVEQWVEVFRATGLDDAQMDRWHVEFERRYPNGHQSFLEWLALPSDRIDSIRKRSASSE